MGLRVRCDTLVAALVGVTLLSCAGTTEVDVQDSQAFPAPPLASEAGQPVIVQPQPPLLPQGLPSTELHGEEIATRGVCERVKILDLSGDPLNVRAEPTTEAALVGMLDEGDEVAVAEEVEGVLVEDPSIGRSSSLWYRIETAGASGWISSIYAQCASLPAPSTETPLEPTPPVVVEEPAEPMDAPPAETWVWPVTGTTTLAPWKVSWPLGATGGSLVGHMGEDFGKGNNLGQPIFAVAAGTVVHVFKNIGNYKDIIVIEHRLQEPTRYGDEVLYARYGHTASEIEEGTSVTPGQRIGHLVDPVDFVPHLHFELVNEVAQYQGPFCRGCKSSKVWMGPGYTGYNFNGADIDVLDPRDDLSENRFYKPSAVIEANGGL